MPSAAQAADRLPGAAPRARVEAGRRLVEEDQLGVADQREPEVEPAALAAGEPAHAGVALLLQADELDHLVHRPRLAVVAGEQAQHLGDASASRTCAEDWSTTPIRSRQSPPPAPGRSRAPRPRRRRARGSPRGSRRSSSCRRRSGRAARRPRRAATSKSIPRTASSAPYDLRRPRTAIALIRQLDREHAARRERGLRAARQRRRDLRAVGLVADDDHGLAALLRGGPDGVGGRARREPLVGLGLEACRPRELLRGLARAQQRAGQHGVGAEAFGGEALAERPGGSRPSAVSGLSSSGSPSAASAWRTITSRTGRSIVSRSCAPSATSWPMSSPTRRWRGTQLAVFTDARGLDDEEMQRLARELNLSETVFVYRPRPARTRGSGSSRRRSSCRSRVTRRSAPPSCSPGRCSSSEIRLETLGHRPGRARARRRADRLRPDGAAAADLEAVRRGRGAARGPRGRAVGAPGRALRQRRAVRLRRAWLGGRVAALRPDVAALGACRAARRQLLRGRGHAMERGCSRRAAASPRTRRRARPPAARGAPRAPRRIAFGEEIEITQGVEIGAPRRCTRGPTAPRREVERVEVGGSAVIVARGEFRLP